METIIFIDTNKSGSSREAIKAADRLGLYTVLFTNRKNFLMQREEFPDVHEMVYVDIDSETTIKDKILEIQNRGQRIVCITSLIDSYVYISSKLSNEFCGTNFSIEAIKQMEDKITTRKVLQEKSCSPLFFSFEKHVSPNQIMEEVSGIFPLVVKVPISNGSKDVLLVNNKEELKKAIYNLKERNPDQGLLIEEYLIGPQYLVEMIVFNGEVYIAAIIEQQITKKERFIVTGYSISSEISPDIHDNIVETVNSIIKYFNMENGSCHIEMRYVDGCFKLIEINPRISGGAMNKMIEEAYGFNLVEQTLRLFLGLTPVLEKKYNQAVYTHYITIDSIGRLIKVTGRNQASKIVGVKEVFIKPRKGKILTPPRSMGHRYGYVLAAGTTKKEAKNIAEQAARLIRFHLEKV